MNNPINLTSCFAVSSSAFPSAIPFIAIARFNVLLEAVASSLFSRALQLRDISFSNSSRSFFHFTRNFKGLAYILCLIIFHEFV